MASKRYVVTGKYATFKTMGTEGMRVVGLYEGAPVPADVDQDAIDHHLRVNMIAEVPEPAPEPKKAESKAETSDADAKAKAEATAKAAHAASAGSTGAKGG